MTPLVLKADPAMYAGIDTNSSWLRFACVGLDGVPRLVADAHDSELLTTRDIIHVSGNGVLVGNPVLDLILEQPDLRIAREVFRNLSSANAILVDLQSRHWFPDTLAAVVLKKLRRDYEARFDASLQRCAISVSPQIPAAAQDSLLQAARLAGLHEVTLIPSAVAVVAGSQVHQNSGELNLLVCDVGRDQVTVSVVTVSRGRLRLVAFERSAEVTLNTVHDAVREAVTGQFRRQHRGYDPQTDPAARWRLAHYIHQLSDKLLHASTSSVEQSLLLGGRIQTVHVSQSEVAPALQRLAMQILSLSARAAVTAGLTASSIDTVLVANEGGSIPALAGQLIQQFPSADPGQCGRLRPADLAAYGAALLAQDPDITQDWLTTLDTHPSVLESGIGVLGRRADGTASIETLLDAGAPSPWRATKTFYRSSPNQVTTVLTIVALDPVKSEPVPVGRTELRFATDSVTIELDVAITGEVVVTRPEGSVTVGNLPNAGHFLPPSQIDLFNMIQILN